MNSESLTYLFSAFSTKFRDAFEKQMAAIGLHSGQVFILRSLWEDDGQSQAQLVKKLSVSAPTIYNMVIKLSSLEYIEIRKDPDDARIMRVFLTKKGREIKPLVENECKNFEDKIFRNLTETERMMCSLLIQKLILGIKPSK